MPADPAVSAVAPDVDDEDYVSAEDEDFQLDAEQDVSELSSDADEEAAEPAKKKRKTGKKAKIDEDQELDSGDEATIRKAKERKERRRKGKKAKGKRAEESDEDIDLEDDDEEGGTGGFVRTRAMKMQLRFSRRHEERKPLAKVDGATVDVNALWEKMNAPESDLGLRPTQTQQDNEPVQEPTHAVDTEMQNQRSREPEEQPRHSQHGVQMVKIKRTYKFAGEWITEEKVVPKDSAEAKAFLSSGENVELADAEDAVAVDGAHTLLRRPVRKISRFDPNPNGLIKKSWERQPAAELSVGQDARGPKINTVEKSRLDWAQYVDQAGIQDELRVHSRAKEGYMGRMDFLGRMEDKREEERRNARLKTM
ncbi:hypothetical protein N7474_004663 [Penicillium riverlandense]|uniref:uncharacterized protein n=1 Tax=Penicillium riverlandense TaxID=1903569 RepID=UPI0025498093|nr:uncharacterized protein N7474_004663 [Penicillium riverlandense]KAJ5819072.1 hypothetical protein N7474_004663 [Penicillium riverlandense]